MKNLLLYQCSALFCSLFLFNAAVAQPNYKIDSIQQFNLDESSMILKMDLRSHNTFDNDGTKETYKLSLAKDLSDWANLTNSTNTYDTNNNIVESIMQTWDPDNSIWMNSSKTAYEYDSEQNNTLITNFITIDNGEHWIVFADNQMDYNADNQIIMGTTRNLDFLLSSLVNTSNTLYYYTNMHNTETIHQNWNAAITQFVNYERDIFTYAGNLAMQEDRYHYSTNDWDAVPFERGVFTYNGSDQLWTLITQVNNGGTFVNSEKVTNSYSGNKLSEIIMQNYNIGTTDWDNSDRTTFAYDSNSNLNEYNNYDWTASDWRNIFRLRQFWSLADPFNLGIEDQNLAVIKVYPNPFHDLLEIRLKAPLDSEGEINLYDIYGKEIISTHMLQGQDHINIDLNTISSGMYLINFNTLNQHKTFKVVKQ